jgi:uncharacterized protein (DUF2336 family)
MSVHALRARLTQADIARLSARDPRARAVSARKVCARFSGSGLSEAERAAGEQILRIIAEDAAEMVRRSLSVTLARSPHLPADLARKLAADVEEIAIPVIAGSPVLDDDDLIDAIRTGSVRRQKAVASRDAVSETVTTVIAAEAESDAVAVAAANDGAVFGHRAYDAVFSRFENAPEVIERFIDRQSLPLELTERLISRISDAALQRMINRHALPAQVAVELAEGARERATVDLVEQAGLSPEPRRFVQQLQMNARLSPSLVLRALFRGHMTFFEHCIAELSGLEHPKAWLLIHDAGPLGLENVFERTGLPRKIFPAVKAAIAAYHSLEMGGDGPRDVIRFRKALTERIFTQFQGAPDADLAYCLERLDMDARGLFAGEDLAPALQAGS